MSGTKIFLDRCLNKTQDCKGELGEVKRGAGPHFPYREL